MPSDTRTLGLLGRAVLALLALFVVFVVVTTVISVALSIVWTVLAVVVPVVVFALIAYAAVTMYQSAGAEANEGRRSSKSPEERLKERYVEGEIDEVEYERRLEQYLDPVDLESLDDEARSREYDVE